MYLSCAFQGEIKMNKLISIFAFDPTIDAASFARDCRDWGITHAILHPGFFSDDKMREALAHNGIDLWLNFQVFNNPDYLKSHPDFYSITGSGNRAQHEWCHFVCAGRDEYIDYFLEAQLPLAAKLLPSIVSLDFIRYFVFWELVEIYGPVEAIEDGCYCPRCLEDFSKFCGHDIPPLDAVSFIHQNALTEWGEYKRRRITATASLLIHRLRELSPASSVWIKTVPWRSLDLDGAIITAAGQDIKELGMLVDGIAPMAFTRILHQTAEWKEALLREVRMVSGKPVVSYVQVDQAYAEGPISAVQFESELTGALEGDAAGISIFCYEQLVKSPEKTEILKKSLR